MYGPLNTYLTLIFPPSQHYLVKLQGHLLPGTESETVHFEETEEAGILYLTESDSEPEGDPQPGPPNLVSDLADNFRGTMSRVDHPHSFMSHIHSLSWCSTLEPACCINSLSSVSHWYAMMRQMLWVSWLPVIG